MTRKLAALWKRYRAACAAAEAACKAAIAASHAGEAKRKRIYDTTHVFIRRPDTAEDAEFKRLSDIKQALRLELSQGMKPSRQRRRRSPHRAEVASGEQPTAKEAYLMRKKGLRS